MPAAGLALMIGLGCLVALFFLLIFVRSAYNRLVSLRNGCKSAYAQIDVQLKRRYDLIASLVETAKGCIMHERDTLEAVVKARNAAFAASQTAAANPGAPGAVKILASAESGLTGALGRLMAVAQAHPDLKSNQNMMKITAELTSADDKIASARQAYNDAVIAYNTQREIFPSKGLLNFGPAERFVIDAPEKEPSKMQF